MSYISQTKEFIAQAKSLIDSGAIEARIRENFASYLRTMFPPDTKWVDEHIKHGEEHVRLNRHGVTVSGFIDNCIANTAIEYEKNLTIQTVFQEGYRQVKEYCASFVREGIDFNIIQGVLSDTLNWYVYKVEPNPSLDRSEYNEGNIELSIVDELHISECTDAVAQNIIDFLSKYLGREGGRAISAERLAIDFGLNSKFSQHYLECFEEYVNMQIESKPQYFSMLRKLWDNYTSIASVSYEYMNSKTSYINEFYISILAKLLCANFLERKALNSNAVELKSIVDGSFFANHQLVNFAEYDYFGWLVEDEIERILPTISSMQRDLSVYDFSVHIEEDLFGNLMIQLADRSQRLLLGQELTPTWLSNMIVRKTLSLLPDGRVPVFADMCCGSGSMVVSTLKSLPQYLVNCAPEEKLNIVMKSITGFDIDPLAVILAKINWIIAAHNIISFDSDIYIPIYHADSLFIQSPISIQEDSCLLQLHDEYISIPLFLVRETNGINLFDSVLDVAYDCIHNELSLEDICHIAEERIDLSVLSEEDKQACINFLFSLYRTIRSLDLKGQNGIWSFVLKNTLRPTLVTANFNGIVSNTPWLALSKLGNNPYKEALRILGRSLGILPTGASAPHVELATIFLVNSVKRYLSEGGVFGCILPHSVLAGNNHTPFRTGQFASLPLPIKLNPNCIWELPNDTFKNKAIAIFGRKQDFCQSRMIEGAVIVGKEQVEDSTFFVQNSGNLQIWTNNPSNVERIDFSHYKFQQGADIMPRYLFFFNLESIGHKFKISKLSLLSDYGYFLKDMKVGKDFCPPTISIEKERFNDVLLSNILTPFHIGTCPKALLPIKRDEKGVWTNLEEVDLLSMQRPLRNFFDKTKETYIAYKKKNVESLFDVLNVFNKLEKQQFESGSYLVVYGAGGSKTCAAYIKVNSEIIIDQTVYYYIAENEDEAIFMTALLNSNSLANVNAAYQAQGQFGKRHIHTLPADSIPAYDSTNSLHQDLVSVSKSLVESLEEKVSSDKYDPNNGPVAARRKAINKVLASLPEYSSYEELCMSIITEQ